MGLPFDSAGFKFVAGVETKVAELTLPPPKLLVAENCFAERTGALRKRKGITTLSNSTVDAGTADANPEALARYKNRLMLFGGPASTAAVYEYSETAARWTEHGTYAPGVLQFENMSASGGGQGVYQVESDVCSGYTLTAEVNEGPNDSGTFNATVRVSLQDAFGTFICHRMQVFSNGSGATVSGLLNLRVVHRDTKFYVFFADDANRDLKVWICDVASAATITTAIGASGGGSSSSPVTVAANLHATGMPAFDVVASGSNGIFLAYRTSTANRITIGFVDTVGGFAGTTNLTTTGDAIQVAVAFSTTAIHGVSYINGAASDVFAVLLSWSGSAWTTTSTSAALDTFAGDPAVSLACRFDSSTTLRMWYTADRTNGTATLDTGRHITFQSTYNSSGVSAVRVLRVRRAILASRPFLATDSKLYYWVLVGRRSVTTPVQPTHFLIESATGLPVAMANYGVAATLLQAPVAVTDRDGAYLASLLYITKIVDGAPSAVLGAENVGVRNVSWFLEHPQSHKVLEVGESLYMAGGLLQHYDGVSFVEAGFLRYVESDTIGLAQSTVGGTKLTLLGQYYYRVIPEWVNSRGEREQGTDSGPLATFTLTGGNDTITLTIPTLMMTRKRRTNAVASNHHTARNELVWAIYRTGPNPASRSAPFYRIGQVANSTSADDVTFVDGNADSTITDNEQLYLSNGEVSHTAAPTCHIMAEGNGRVFLAGADANTVYYSLIRSPGEPVNFNAAFTIIVPDFGGSITGLAIMNDALVVLKERAIYRVRGAGPNNTLSDGGSFFDPELVSNEVGLVGQRSIVVAPFGVMFQSPRGIYLLTSGYQLEYVGASLEGLTGSQAVSTTNAINGAVLLTLDQQVRFTSDSITWVFDYYHKIWTVYTNQNISGPSVEWNAAHAWAGTDDVQYEAATVFTAANMRVVLAIIHMPQSMQESFRVRLVGVTGEFMAGGGSLRVKLYANHSASVGQTSSETGLTQGNFFRQYGIAAGCRVVSALKVEIDDNGSTTATLSLNEVVLELARRRRGPSSRVG